MTSLLCIGEGNGNPLQCSCLENPRDGRAWWADVYGVTQSQTQLKQQQQQLQQDNTGSPLVSTTRLAKSNTRQQKITAGEGQECIKKTLGGLKAAGEAGISKNKTKQNKTSGNLASS